MADAINYSWISQYLARIRPLSLRGLKHKCFAIDIIITIIIDIIIIGTHRHERIDLDRDIQHPICSDRKKKVEGTTFRLNTIAMPRHTIAVFTMYG